MIVLSFDLSTSCTGVTESRIEQDDILNMCTYAIIPPKFNPITLGFLKDRKPVATKNFKAYLHNKEEVVTLKEKKARDVAVGRASEEHYTEYITQSITGAILRAVANYGHVDLVLMEENMAFRSMDVTRKLGEISGILQALAISNNIPIVKVNVHKARGYLQIEKEMSAFASTLPEKVLASSKFDLTKETLKYLMLERYKRYNLSPTMTTDESDSLVIFTYWYDVLRKEKTHGKA